MFVLFIFLIVFTIIAILNIFIIFFEIFTGGEDIVAKKLQSKKKWDEITFKECSFKPTLISKQCSSNDFYNSKKFNLEESEESKSRFENDLNFRTSSSSMKSNKNNNISVYNKNSNISVYDKNSDINISNFSTNDFNKYNNSIDIDNHNVNNNVDRNNDYDDDIKYKRNNYNYHNDNKNSSKDVDNDNNSNNNDNNDNNNKNKNNDKNKNVDDFDLDYQDFQNGKTSKIKIKRFELEDKKFASRNNFDSILSSSSKIFKKSNYDETFNSKEEKIKLKKREIERLDCEKFKIKTGYYI